MYSVLEIEDNKQKLQSDLISVDHAAGVVKGGQKNLLSNESDSGLESSDEIDHNDVDRLLEDIEANQVPPSNRNQESINFF